MEKNEISKATLGRLPVYLKYLRSLPDEVQTVSATTVARELGLGEVQVRKDLGALSCTGRPRIGYVTGELIDCMERILREDDGNAVIVGAGKLGKALLDYGGFAGYGIRILAAFDVKVKDEENVGKKRILPVGQLSEFCRRHAVRIGIIAVPAEAAQEVCELLYQSGVKAMCCFSPCRLRVPKDAVVQYENMALSLAHLKMQLKSQR